jgi:hypothetical protein
MKVPMLRLGECLSYCARIRASKKLVAYPRQNRLWRKGEINSLYEQPGVHPVNSFIGAAVPAAFLLIFTSGPKMSLRESNRLV